MNENSLKIEKPFWWKRRPRTEKYLYTTIAILVLLIIIILAVQTGFVQSVKLTNATCVSPNCVKVSSAILGKLNGNVDPCDDFYEFACGSFLKNTPIPEDTSEITSLSQAKDVVELRMKTLLEKPIQSSDIKAIFLAKSLYQSCMNLEDIENNSISDLKALIKAAGGWPVIDQSWAEEGFDWIETSYKFMDNGFQANMFLVFEIARDTQDSSRKVLFLNQVDFVLDKIKRNGFNETIFQSYHRYMVKVALALGAENGTAMQDMTAVADLITTIARITLPQEERRDPSRENNPMSLKTLTEKYPYAPWLPYVNKMLAPYKTLTDNDTIIVKVPSYYEKLEAVLKNTSNRTLANYMFWAALEGRIKYLNQELRDLQLDFFRSVIGVVKRPPRWKDCTQMTTELYVASGAIYVRNFLQKNTKKNLVEMINFIKAELIEDLKTLQWMDAKTKNHAIQKAENMFLYIAYPDELLDDEKVDLYYTNLTFSPRNLLGNMLNLTLLIKDVQYPELSQVIDKKDWRNHAYVALVAAYNDASENSIELLAGILQSVFFDVSRPNYMNFGAIGHIIGHEMTHSFDDEGRHYDKNGNLVDWWEPATKAAFEAKKQCMIDQYSNITVPEANSTINGVLTQGENIADNAGIKLAYLAYKAWAKQHGDELPLPGLMYTPEQLFWITVAHVWCEVKTVQHIKAEVLTDEHSQGRYRVNVPLMNSPFFAKDFQCEEGKRMNPRDKCQVW